MDIAPPNQHPATSDDELAKVLAGIGADDSPTPPAPAGNSSNAEAAGLQFEETPGPMPAGQANVNSPVPTSVPAAPVAPVAPAPAPLTGPEPAPVMSAPAPNLPVAAGGLEELKKTALEELRPLVGKLNLPPEDKFDTLLLIIRSTDDQTLLEPAHEAAKQITDENKRAQALLDVIKEIDYFAQGGQPPALPAL
jgi:hypothetical protein